MKKGVTVNTYRVLIVDYMDYDSAGEIPYLCKKAGCEVDVFCTSQSWLLKNGYHDSCILYKNKEPKYFLRALRDVLNNRKYDWVFTVDDVSLDIINSCVDQDSVLKCILPLSKMENRIMLGSKAGFSLLCKKYNLLTPNFLVYDYLENDQKFIDSVKENLSFPILLKVDKSAGGVGIFVCQNDSGLSQNFNSLSQAQKKSLVAQNYISGKNISIETIFHDGKLLAYAYSSAKKTFRGEFGISAVREYSQAPEVESALSKIGADFGINGFSNMTFVLENKTNRYFFIEADLRTNAWLRLAIFAGVDFSLGIKSFLSGKNILIRPDITTQNGKLTIGHFSRDIALSVINKDVKSLLKCVLNLDGGWRYLPWYDWKILVFTFLNMLRSGVKFFVNEIFYRKC